MPKCDAGHVNTVNKKRERRMAKNKIRDEILKPKPKGGSSE